MKKNILPRVLILTAVLGVCLLGIGIAAKKHKGAEKPRETAFETVSFGEQAEGRQKNLPASPTDFPAAAYSPDLIRRNSISWGIQNGLIAEDMKDSSVTRQWVKDWCAGQGFSFPDLETGDPGEILPTRTLLKLTYSRVQDPSFPLEAISDQTLTAWAQAVRLTDTAPDLSAPASAKLAARCLYYLEDGKYELENGLMRLMQFYQGLGFWDGRTWRHKEWPVTTFAINGHVMNDAGCGFFATAMALSYLSERFISPIEFKENGEYTGNGAAHTIGVNTAAQYGIPAHRTADWKEAKEALRDGLPVMVLEGPGMWAKTGHFILLAGILPDGTLAVYNPGGDPHTQYNPQDYGFYTEDQINGTANPELTYTIFGK